MLDMRERKPINLTLDPAVIAELDEWVSRQEPRTTRSGAVELAIKRLLAADRAARKAKGK